MDIKFTRSPTMIVNKLMFIPNNQANTFSYITILSVLTFMSTLTPYIQGYELRIAKNRSNLLISSFTASRPTKRYMGAKMKVDSP